GARLPVAFPRTCDKGPFRPLVAFLEGRMPSGLYQLFDDNEAPAGTEQFRCAPGPMGWRYFSTVQGARGTTNVDLSVDAGWRPVRVRIQTPEHHLLLSARGSLLDDEQLDVPFDPERQTVDFPSPCFPL